MRGDWRHWPGRRESWSPNHRSGRAEEYIQQDPAPPSATQYWYYCQNAGAYYPYVQDCPGGWMQVVPSPNPPDR
jgi:hypothetical protein